MATLTYVKIAASHDKWQCYDCDVIQPQKRTKPRNLHIGGLESVFLLKCAECGSEFVYEVHSYRDHDPEFVKKVSRSMWRKIWRHK